LWPWPTPHWRSFSPADLFGLDLVCLLVGGVHFGEHCCAVALGIGVDGTKHPLALVEGSAENATLARDLMVGLRERGLDVTRPILVVIDGAKALRRTVTDASDHPVVARCQQHKGPQRTQQAARAAGWVRTQRCGNAAAQAPDRIAPAFTCHRQLVTRAIQFL
jgi:hypothetical protein